MPGIWREAEHRKLKRIFWIPLLVPTVLRFDLYAEQKTHKVFMVEAAARAPHQSAVPLSRQEITFQKLNATGLSIFLAENFQN